MIKHHKLLGTSTGHFCCCCCYCSYILQFDLHFIATLPPPTPCQIWFINSLVERSFTPTLFFISPRISGFIECQQQVPNECLSRWIGIIYKSLCKATCKKQLQGWSAACPFRGRWVTQGFPGRSMAALATVFIFCRLSCSVVRKVQLNA